MKNTSSSMPPFEFLQSFAWKDYQLIDSGNGRKLERCGPYLFDRPESQALWQPRLSTAHWNKADAQFIGGDQENGGHWEFRHSIQRRWLMHYGDLSFWAEATPFRHLGFFPEQANHWDFTERLITRAQRPIRVLNLFGYTGVASLAAAKAGAQVTHVDASKKMITWAHENQVQAGLTDKPIRWIVDDALKFVRREARRGSTYDGFIIDPPKFGRGPSGEIWKLEESLPALLHECRALLSEQPLFFIITAYAIRASALSLYYPLQELLQLHNGKLTTGEMALPEEGSSRLLPTSIYARWESANN